MKSLLAFSLAIVMLWGNLSFATEGLEEQNNPFYDRMAFAVEGDVIVYVNFPFAAPYGNCGQVEVYEYEQSYNYPPAEAFWRLVPPGENTTHYRGIYLFRSAKTECDPVVEISGKPLDAYVYTTWSGLEVEPRDIGLLSPVMKSENVFRLNEDDKKFSYIIIFNPFGYKTNLGTIIDNPNVFNMHCDSAGVIVPNQRGFLEEIVLWGKGKKAQRQKEKFLEEAVIDRDEIFINICREHFPE